MTAPPDTKDTMSMREIPYEPCDVFTDRPLAGNALAVFTEAVT
jgi:predicted PhzF superfamily epimerase YddE/YHI9